MPLQNRVDPFGAIHAVTHRGMFMGNRGGRFHRDDRTLKDRHWASRQWIVCVLEFKGRKRPLMQPGLYTELFFLDEATALACGHRPCFECRRKDAAAFRDVLVAAGRLVRGQKAGEIDAQLAGGMQEILTGRRARPPVNPAALPDGAMYAAAGSAWLKQGNAARRWSFSGYAPAGPLHAEGLRLTPELTCDALAAGYEPVLHSSAYA